MAAVWYTGRSDSITITTEDWARIGIDGASTVVWNKANGWSNPRAGFTTPQLNYLTAAGSFNVNGDDGPRPDAAISVTEAPYLRESDLVNLGLLEKRDRVIAHATNRSGVATVATVTPTVAPIPGCMIDIPPSGGRIFRMKWGALWGVTTAGAGRFQLPVYEVINGSAVLFANPYQLVQATSPVAGLYGGWMESSWIDIGIVTSSRKFGLYCSVTRDAGSNLAAYTHNLDSPGAFPFITVEEK